MEPFFFEAPEVVKKGTIFNQIEEARRNTALLMRASAARIAEYELPEPGDLFQTAEKELNEDECRVVVLGEKKNGKSTFINALLGEELLPTDERVATSRVFRIRHADKPSFLLRFEDDSTREIAREDLFRYGSQVYADQHGDGDGDTQLIRWIEVNVPARYLPPNVVLFDTPGVGALYAAHAEITHRILPQAHAAIFLLTSERPMIEAEAAMFKRVFSITPHVLMVQSKIQENQDRWQENLARSTEIIAKLVADWSEKRRNDKDTEQLPPIPCPRIFPIDGKCLLDSAQESNAGAEDYLEDSRFNAVYPSYRALTALASTWSRTAIALARLNYQHGLGKSVLDNRLQALATQKNDTAVEAQKRLRKLKESFSEDGKRGKEIETRLVKILNTFEKEMGQILDPRHDTWAPISRRIKDAKKVDELKEIKKAMGEETCRIAAAAWSDLCNTAEMRINELLAVVNVSLDQEMTSLCEIGNPDSSDAEEWTATHGGWFEKARTALYYGRTGTTLTGVAAGVLVGLGVLSMPVAVPIVIAAGVWTFVRGWFIENQRQVQAAQNDVQNYLRECIRKIRSVYLDHSMREERYDSVVSEYRNESEARAKCAIVKAVKKSIDATQKEIDRIAAEQVLAEEERKTALVTARKRVTEWSQAGTPIAQALSEHNKTGAVLISCLFRQ
jgi:GTPase SAR1 family protein